MSKTKTELQTELEQAYRRIAELESAVLDASPLPATMAEAQDSKYQQTEQIMAECETRTRELLEAMPDAIITIGADGKILSANAQAEKMFGYTQKELVGAAVETLVPHSLREWHVENRAKYMEQPIHVTTIGNREILGLRQGGEEFPAEVSLSHHNLTGGEAVILCAVRDVSERRRSADLIASQRDLAKLANTSMPNEEMWAACLREALQVSKLDGGGVYLFDEKARAFVLVHHQGLSAEFIGAVTRFEEGTPNGQLALSGKTIFFTEAELQVKSYHRAEGLRSAAVVPIQYHEQVLGCLNLASRALPSIPDWSRAALETVAVEIGNIVIHRRTEESLQASREQLSRALTTAHMGTWRYHIPTARIDWSSEAASIFGIEKQQNDFDTILTKFHPDDRERTIATLQEVLTQNKALNMEYRIFDAKGNIRWVAIYGQVEFDAEGNPPQTIMGLIQDITERKRFENALVANEKKLKSLIDSETHFVIRVNMQGKYSYWNRRFESEFGWLHQAEGMENSDVMTAVCSYHRERVRQVVEKCIVQPGQVFSVEIDKPAKGGGVRSTLWEFMALTDENNKPIEVQCMGIEITERKRAEEALRENRSRIELALKGANAGMWDWNIKTGEAVFDERWAQIMGYTLEELAPVNIQTWTSLCHPDDLKVSNELLQKHFNGELDYYECEARMKHKNGSWVWVVDRGKVMEWEKDGKPLRMFGTHLDITESKREERYTRARLKLANLFYEALDMETLMRLTLDEAEAITDSQIGFFHFVDGDQNTISLQAWSTNTTSALCKAEGKGQHYPVAEAGVWADGIRSGKAYICNDYASLPNCRQLPLGHAPITRLISIPIIRNNMVVAAMGVGNKFTDYDQHDLEMVRRIAEYAFDIILRKRAEESLRESEEKYRGLMESLNTAISTANQDGTFLYLNDMAAESLGGTPQELIGKKMWEVFPEPYASRQLAAVQKVFQTDRETVYETQSMIKNELRWYRAAFQPLHSKTGQVEQVLINVTDIHDLKTAQQELQELNRTLEEKVAQRSAEVQDLYDNAPTGYHSLDADGNYVLVNQTELNWLGYTREEMLGRAIRDFMTEASQKIYREKFPLFLQRGWSKDVEVELFRKDGSILPVVINSTAIHDSDGNFVMSRSTILDITERKQAERALRESGEQNRLLFEESPIPIALLDGVGHILHANRAYEQLAGIPRSELYGKTAEAMGLVDPETTARLTEAMLESMSRQENVAIVEHPLTSADGTRRIVESHAFILQINSVIHVLVTTNDISTHKAAEEALLRANLELERAMRMKDEFLATMSHELRTPLTGILGLSEALQLEVYGSLTERQAKTIATIEHSGRHLLELINDVLDLSKIEAGKLELETTRCSLEDIFQASLHLTKGMAHQKKQRVSYTASIEPIFLDVDPRRIKQVIVNLISNAIKFTPEEGELGLVAEQDKTTQQVLLTVWDKGIGIKPENLPKLFQPFSQIDSSLAREYSGTGLGLALVRRLVELHNGSVKVESVFGEGSRFIVTLPYAPPHADDSPSAESGNDPQQGAVGEVLPSPMILIVDDNQVVLGMVSDFLEAKQFRTAQIQSGMELLEKIEDIKPHVILMDIQMPGMDGLEAIRRVRAHQNAEIASTLIIAVTALAMPGDRDLCLKAGANDYISKPVKLTELVETLKHLTKG